MNKTLAQLESETLPPIQKAQEAYEADKIVLDTEQVFLLYTTFCGDAEKTAAALGCSSKAVAHLALSENWDDKIKPIVELRKTKKPGDVERAINRAISFVQATRYRTFIERTMQKMLKWNDKELDEFLIKVESKQSKDGEVSQTTKVQARALADFAVAMQKCHEMCYMALNDTTPERSKRKESEGDAEMSLTTIHAQLARGMAESEPKTAVGQLMASQVQVAQAVTAEAVRVDSNPYNLDH